MSDHQLVQDRITNLPDSLLHDILSLASQDIKEVARTRVLSKRWYHLWKSTPTLDLRSLAKNPLMVDCPYNDFDSEFMDIVDKILHLHDMSSIKKLCISWNDEGGMGSLNGSRVNLWIAASIMRRVEELSLNLCLDEEFLFTSLSHGTCDSLVTLQLHIDPCFYLPRLMSFPKLKHLKLTKAKFSSMHNGQQPFCSCPVLESLMLDNCEFNIKNFCLSIPSLKVLSIRTYDIEEEECYYYMGHGLRKCAFEIHAPSLESLTFSGEFAEEYVMSNFLTLEKVDVRFDLRDYVKTMKADSSSKFLRALLHVKCMTTTDRSLEVITHDLTTNLPTFHNLKELNMTHDAANYTALTALLKSAPNLESLVLISEATDSFSDRDSKDNFGVKDNSDGDSEDDFGVKDNSDDDRGPDLSLHLKSVRFEEFDVRHRSQMKWVELFLKSAAALETMTFRHRYPSDKNRMEKLKLELESLKELSADIEFDLGDSY